MAGLALRAQPKWLLVKQRETFFPKALPHQQRKGNYRQKKPQPKNNLINNFARMNVWTDKEDHQSKNQKKQFR